MKTARHSIVLRIVKDSDWIAFEHEEMIAAGAGYRAIKTTRNQLCAVLGGFEWAKKILWIYPDGDPTGKIALQKKPEEILAEICLKLDDYVRNAQEGCRFLQFHDEIVIHVSEGE